MEQAEATKQLVDQLTNRINQLDTILTDQEAGLMKDNARLKDETVQLKKTAAAYETRLSEMELEVQVSILSNYLATFTLFRVLLLLDSNVTIEFAEHQKPDERADMCVRRPSR